MTGAAGRLKGVRVGPYELRERIGMGGMAEVRSRGAREVSWRGEIRVDDGGEATGRSSFWLRAPPSS